MIIDETMAYKLISPFKYSDDGNTKAEAVTLEFSYPPPRLSKDIFKLRRFTGKALANITKAFAGVQREEPVELISGSIVKPLHEKFSESKDDPKKRERLLAEIDKEASEKEAMFNLADVDLDEFTTIFAKMVCGQNRCKINGGNVYLTITLWNEHIAHDDRLKMAVMYCSFFGLTSSMID